MKVGLDVYSGELIDLTHNDVRAARYPFAREDRVPELSRGWRTLRDHRRASAPPQFGFCVGTGEHASPNRLEVPANRPCAETTAFDLGNRVRTGRDSDLMAGSLSGPGERKHRQPMTTSGLLVKRMRISCSADVGLLTSPHQ